MKRKQSEEQRMKEKLNVLLISVFRKWSEKLEPFSPAWCDCQNALTLEIAKLEERMGWQDGC